MTFDQVERAIQFCLDQQAAFRARNAELQASLSKLEVGHEKLKEELEILKELSRNLLTVAQMHSRRLDRLDGIGAS
jgi:hypothetical protein